MTGVIKTVRTDRGYGFIQPTDGGPDIFFHRSELSPELEWGEQLIERRVSFNPVMKDGKERAVALRPVA